MEITEIKAFVGATPIDGDSHVDVPLGNVAVEAFQDPNDENMYVGDQIFPAVGVSNRSDKYYVIEKDEFLRDPGAAALRAPGTNAREVMFRVSSDSYFTNNYALAAKAPVEEIDAADAPLQVRENMTRLVVGNLRLSQEIRIANICTSGTNLGSYVALTGTNKWSDPNGSDPIADVTTGQAFVRQNTGLRANTLVLDEDTFQIIRRHPLLLDLFKYTDGGLLSMDHLKSAFSIPNILVAGGIKNTANEGATFASSNVWGNTALLVHVQRSMGIRTRTFGLRMQWKNPAYPANFGVKRARYDQAGQANVEVVEVGHQQDEKVVAKSLSYGILNTL